MRKMTEDVMRIVSSVMLALAASHAVADVEKDEPALCAEVGRKDSQLRFSAETNKTIIDITSVFGIDKATISRKSNAWPKSMVVRLHLSGLESFKVSNEKVTVEWSVSSTRDNLRRVSLRSGKKEMALSKESPYFTNVQIIGGNGTIPLKAGHLEVALPAKLFEDNPQRIRLQWIDFYRN
jgi:hypothetical protein